MRHHCDKCLEEMPELDGFPVMRVGYLMCNACFDSGVAVGNPHAVTERLGAVVRCATVKRPMSSLKRASKNG
jgi:hypothetical protein